MTARPPTSRLEFMMERFDLGEGLQQMTGGPVDRHDVDGILGDVARVRRRRASAVAAVSVAATIAVIGGPVAATANRGNQSPSVTATTSTSSSPTQSPTSVQVTNLSSL